LVGLLAIVGFGKRRFEMPEWMMGVTVVLVLIAPCLIAMRMEIENAED
jgi:hypothetical protein